MSNLDNYTRGTNSDWALWVKLVKRVYKEKGYNLTQQQALIVAKDSYPGKGNVVNRKEKELNKMTNEIEIKDELPENPVRRKKEPKPKEKAEIYRREKSPPRNKKLKYDYDDDLPPRRRRERSPEPRRRRERSPEPRRRRERSPESKKRRERNYDYDDDTPPRRSKYYSSDEESPEPRRRRR